MTWQLRATLHPVISSAPGARLVESITLASCRYRRFRSRRRASASARARTRTAGSSSRHRACRPRRRELPVDREPAPSAPCNAGGLALHELGPPSSSSITIRYAGASSSFISSLRATRRSALFMKSSPHRRSRRRGHAEGVAGGDDAPRALADDVADARHRRLPQHRAVDLALAQVGGDDLDRLVEASRGLILVARSPGRGKRCAQLPCGVASCFAVQPLDHLLAASRPAAQQHAVAALPAEKPVHAARASSVPLAASAEAEQRAAWVEEGQQLRRGRDAAC